MSDDICSIRPSELHRSLLGHYGWLDWWHADGPFEVMVGALLAQRTKWSNVERTLVRLRDAGIKDPEALMSVPREELEGIIRPSGAYRQKAEGLRGMFALVMGESEGDLDDFLARPTKELRRELLSVRRVGPETADSILLFAAGRPVFVVDAYTRRVMGRLGVKVGESYEEVASWFTQGLPEEPRVYANLHATIVELAKDHCRASPLCEGCPLRPYCATGGGPDGGPGGGHDREPDIVYQK